MSKLYFTALFEKYAEWKIIDFFLNNPNSEFYVKELSRKLDMSSGTVSTFMRNIEKDKLFLKKTIGNVHLYKLNQENKIVSELIKIHELNKKNNFAKNNQKRIEKKEIKRVKKVTNKKSNSRNASDRKVSSKNNLKTNTKKKKRKKK